MAKKFFLVSTKATFACAYGFQVEEDKIEEFKRTVQEKITRFSLEDLTQNWLGEEVVQISEPMDQEEYEQHHDTLVEDAVPVNTSFGASPNLLIVIDYDQLKEDDLGVLTWPEDEP